MLKHIDPKILAKRNELGTFIFYVPKLEKTLGRRKVLDLSIDTQEGNTFYYEGEYTKNATSNE